ncbi:hypothetical protein KKF25_01910 [Patescibacteria group bacterium]|nr:hypothetical protein [Patescibacteria group bacterium]
MTCYNRKNSSFVDPQKGRAAWNILIIFGLLLLCVLYLGQTNSVVAKNFELRAAQSALKAKQAANQEAMISLMQAKSLSNLANAAKSLNLVAVESVDYLKIVPDFFALSQQP